MVITICTFSKFEVVRSKCNVIVHLNMVMVVGVWGLCVGMCNNGGKWEVGWRSLVCAAVCDGARKWWMW